MAAADTNVLLRLLLEDDEEQSRAARSFLRSHARIFVSHVVLAEIAWVLASAHDFSREDLLGAVEMLVEMEGIELQDPSVVQTAVAHYRSSTAGFSDCLVLAIAGRAGETPLATFDRRLGRVKGARTLGGRLRRR